MAKKPALKPEKLPPRAPDCAMVIFGAQGDLAKRLLVPALYNLADAKLLGRGFRVLGVDHGAGDDAALRKGLGGFLRGLAASKDSEFGAAKIDASAWTWLEDRLFYQLGDFEDDATYTGLAARLADLVGRGASVLFYLAVAPNFFGDVVQRLGKVGLLKEPAGAFRRVVVEKPFGHDLASAKALNKRLLTWLTESQIYRIDHFLGKETVRNIMVTRFGNGIFEPLWNRLNIDSVQITAAETVGVESRGSFYEKTGALRDMVTNHLLQLLGMVAMEAPNSFDADAVRAEKGRVIEAIRHLTPAQAAKDSVRGQYTAGKVLGQKMVGYRQSPKVDPHSDVETFVAVKLEIDNWRWAGVPFYLRTGKAMTAHDTEITIQFKAAPQTLFQDHCVLPSRPNALVLHIQPNEGISLFFDAKRPGPDIDVTGVRMDFRYADFFKVKPATGYETLIYDCLTGDQTLFKRSQDIEYDWAAVMPFLKAWKAGGKVEKYAAGTDGPAAAKAFMARDGRTWKPLGQ